MLIENTEARIIHLSTGARLMPGVNDISPEEWQKAELHPVVAAMVKVGMLKTMGKSAKVLAPVVETLTSFSASDAEDLVMKTYDRGLLSRWLSGEKRGKIKKIIEAQIEELTVKPKVEG